MDLPSFDQIGAYIHAIFRGSRGQVLHLAQDRVVNIDLEY